MAHLGRDAWHASTCAAAPPTRRCVTRKSRRSREHREDSRTPRRLSRMSATIAALATTSLYGSTAGGSTLNNASAPPAMETEMVST